MVLVGCGHAGICLHGGEGQHNGVGGDHGHGGREVQWQLDGSEQAGGRGRGNVRLLRGDGQGDAGAGHLQRLPTDGAAEYHVVEGHRGGQAAALHPEHVGPLRITLREVVCRVKREMKRVGAEYGAYKRNRTMEGEMEDHPVNETETPKPVIFSITLLSELNELQH